MKTTRAANLAAAGLDLLSFAEAGRGLMNQSGDARN